MLVSMLCLKLLWIIFQLYHSVSSLRKSWKWHRLYRLHFTTSESNSRWVWDSNLQSSDSGMTRGDNSAWWIAAPKTTDFGNDTPNANLNCRLAYFQWLKGWSQLYCLLLVLTEFGLKQIWPPCSHFENGHIAPCAKVKSVKVDTFRLSPLNNDSIV